jgi:hypothetical protein
MVVRNRKKEFYISIFGKELSILEAVGSMGPCTAAQVQEKLNDGTALLLVMRRMHILADRGLLERITLNKQRFYQVKPNYSMVRAYLKVTDGQEY